MKSFMGRSRMALLAISVFSLTAPVSHADRVLLEAPDGTVRFEGELIALNDTEYVLQTGAGSIRISRNKVNCTGAGCPTIEKPQADLVIRGSDTVGEELMPLLIEGYANQLDGSIGRSTKVGADTTSLEVTNMFSSREPVLVTEVQAAGSSTGLRALIENQADIAMSSRPARPSEVEAVAQQGRGNILNISQEYVIAVDSILTVISPDNFVNELSVQQVAEIFSGRIRNWSEVGGPNMPVTVYTRPATSGTRGVFEEKILEPVNFVMSPNAVVLGSNEEIAEAVTRDRGGIGYVGFASKRGTKPVDLIASCGLRMKATDFSAKTEEYLLERRLRLFVDNGPRTEHERGLLDFAISSQADALIQKAGFIDLGIKVSSDPLDTNMLMQSALESNETQSLEALRRMLNDLNGAQRLSTTFRFETGSARLDNKSLRDVKRVVDYLSQPQMQNREVIVAGYTDDFGKFDANARLSESRAFVALQTLLNHPDAGELRNMRVRSVGYSELAPVACNDTTDGQRRNRRVEIWIK
ncbi:substrate-binding domain-containing protein [Pseudaestuariivita rosea]|uniref:substrate-binding domain-containing protein n=1 Tax=Pseudaestuariivita rosea TaxID=2763263 RepID=UPI001ABAF04F|nr:phosphate ABC transporter substrate-binding/OmpA family protein [Pseudaestuariivita rosea]